MGLELALGQEYSHGASAARVHRVTPEQARLYPGADLVKVDSSRDRFWAERTYLQHRLAHRLYPDRFIEVVGFEVDPPIDDAVEEVRIQGFLIGYVNPLRQSLLFSKLAEIPHDHAQFARDCTEIYHRGHVKVNNCDCPACVPHRRYHDQRSLSGEALRFGLEAAQAGIHLPINDPSDYCATPNGIIFFELDGIVPEVVKTFVGQTDLDKDLKCETIDWIGRIHDLYKRSFRDSEKGLSVTKS